MVLLQALRFPPSIEILSPRASHCVHQIVVNTEAKDRGLAPIGQKGRPAHDLIVLGASKRIAPDNQAETI